ncbi:MAG: glycosyltransferase family 2 protein [bacterium]|nr:glycosyltransferase family 2 protein [bacterium]
MKKLSVIIPVFNEEKTIEKVINTVWQQPLENWEKEIIVVNDCSTDNTGKILDDLKNKFDFILLKHQKNSGKGTAIKTALSRATGGYVIVQDADLEYNPADWPKMLKELENPKIKVVFGSREMNSKRRGYFHYVLGVRFLTFLTNRLFGGNLTDIYTCYKLISSELIKSLNLSSSGFEIEAEITTKILKRGIKIKEVPINYFPRSFKEGKKIRIYDGLIGVWTILTK